MASRRPTAALLVSAFLCLLTLSAPASALAGNTVPQGFVGVVVNGPMYPTAPGVDLTREFHKMVVDGVQSIRVVFDWSVIQQYRRFSQVPAAQKSLFKTIIGGVPTRVLEMDRIVGTAAQQGLTVLPTVIGAPAWDAKDPTSFLAIPASNRPYGSFVKMLVRRYGPHGSFWRGRSAKLPIRAWQVWNEPSSPDYWPIQPFARSYVALLRVASAAIKSADPRAKVVLAGLANFSWNYLAQIYKVPGARKLFDVVGVHPYTAQPQGVLTIIGNVRNVMNQNGDRRKLIVADEMGWPSSLGQSPFTYGFETTEAGQATNIAAVLPLLRQARKQLGLLGFYYYTWAGIEHRGGYTFDFSGLERFSAGKFVAKPALGAFRRAALGLEGCRKKGQKANICLH